MAKKIAVFLGDVARDEYYTVDEFPVVGDKVLTHQKESFYGGMVANAACVYAAYGGQVKFCFDLNPRDKDLCDELETRGIDTKLVQYHGYLPDSKCLIFLSGDDDSTCFIVTMSDHNIVITPEVVEAVKKADILYSNPFELKRMVVEGTDLTPHDVMKSWAEAGVKIMCDMDVDTVDDAYPQIVPFIDTVFMNDNGYDDLDKATGTGVQSILDMGVKTVVVTLADKGVDIYTADSKIHVDAVPTDVVDVTGAGDTFCSSFVFANGILDDLTQAAIFATYAASRSIMEMGARGGSRPVAEVLEYMKSKGEDTTPFEALLQ